MFNIAEQIRQAIRKQTTLLGATATNLYGAVAGQTSSIPATAPASWMSLTVPGSGQLTLGQFYTQYAALATQSSAILPATNGAVGITGSSGVVHLVRGVVAVGATTTVNLTIDVGSPTGSFALYVDSVLQRNGSDVATIPVALDAGSHLIEIVTPSSSVVVTVPTTVGVSGSADVLVAPTWVSITPGYLDTQTGATGTQLDWANDLHAGGWHVLKRTPAHLDMIVAIGQPSAGGLFAVEIVGEWDTAVNVGADLFASFDHMGTVTSSHFDATTGPNTTFLVRLDPALTTSNQAWTGRTANQGSFSEAARVARGGSDATVTWVDTAVVVGAEYGYVLQSFSQFDETILSPLSVAQYVGAGDVTPPGPITLDTGFPQATDALITAKFLTPPDSDYAGTNVYYRNQVSGGVTGASPATITVDQTLVAGALVGFTVQTSDGNQGTVASNTVNSIAVEGAFNATPAVGAVFMVFQDSIILTKHGLPASEDQCQFAPQSTLPLQYYRFATFDKAGNEQLPGDSVLWQYDTSTRVFSSPVIPIIQLRPLAATEQANFPGFTDTTKWQVVVLTGSNPSTDPATEFDGVTIFYQIGGGPIQSMPAITPPLAAGFPDDSIPAPAPYLIDSPTGTRSRYVAISRSGTNDIITAWAVNAQGLESAVITFSAAFGQVPAMSSIDGSLDTGATSGMGTLGIQYVTVSFDDATVSYSYWLDGAETSADATYVEPTVGAPGVENNTVVDGSVLQFNFALAAGQRKTLNLQAWGAAGLAGVQGVLTQRTYYRSPVTDMVQEGKGPDGKLSTAWIKCTFTTQPAIVVSVADTATSISGVVLTLGTGGLTPGSFTNAVDQYYYLAFTSGPAFGSPAIPIVSNDAGTLTLASVPTVPFNSGDGVGIFAGATLVRSASNVGGLTPALPYVAVLPPVFYLPRQAGQTIEYYSVLTGVPAEAPHRVVVDTDSSATIGSVELSVPVAGTLQVAIETESSDLRVWRSYERKGNWPTLDSTENGTVDPQYLRFEGNPNEVSYQHAAAAAVWNVIVVPFNSYNDSGPPVTASLDTSTATPAGVLSALAVAANDVAGIATNAIGWNYNAQIPQAGTDFTVKIRGYRDDLGTGTMAELTAGFSWLATFTPPTGTSDSGATDSVAGSGKFYHTGLPARGTGGDTKQTWRYFVDLYDLGTLVATYPVSYTDFYKSNVPTLSSAVLTIQPGLVLALLLGNQITQAQINTVSWQRAPAPGLFEAAGLEDLLAATYHIKLLGSTDGGTTYVTIQDNLPVGKLTATQAFNLTVPVSGGTSTAFVYQVQLILTATSAVVQTLTSNTVTLVVAPASSGKGTPGSAYTPPPVSIPPGEIIGLL